jgi:uncharacterized membrane protein
MKAATYGFASASEQSSAAPVFIDVNADCQSIVVNAPASEVYRCLLRFEDLLRFITSVTQIDLVSPTRFSCTSVIDGKEVTSDVRIMMRVPDRRITWQAVSNQFGVGVVFLDPLLGRATRVTLKVRIEPVLLTEALRRNLRILKNFVEEDVARARDA